MTCLCLITELMASCVLLPQPANQLHCLSLALGRHSVSHRWGWWWWWQRHYYLYIDIRSQTWCVIARRSRRQDDWETYEREKETTADEQHMRGLRNSKETSWRQMFVMCLSDGSHWPANTAEYIHTYIHTEIYPTLSRHDLKMIIDHVTTAIVWLYFIYSSLFTKVW